MVWALSVLSLLLAGSLVWLYFISNDSNVAKSGLKNANGKIVALQTQIDNLKIELDTTRRNLNKEKLANDNLLHENDSLRQIFPIYIRKLFRTLKFSSN